MGVLASAYILCKAIANHFLPIAKPIACISFLLIIAQLIHAIHLPIFIDPSLYPAQIFSDIRMFIAYLGGPVMLWLFLEYHYSEKIKLKWLLALFSLPTLVFCIFVINIMANQSYVDHETQQVVTKHFRIAPFFDTVRAISLLIGFGMVAFGAYSIWRKTRSNLVERVLIIVSLSFPVVSILLTGMGVIDIKLGAPLLVFVLIWATRQYGFLDMLPIALPQAVDQVNAGFIMLNKQKQVVYTNQFAGDLLDMHVSGNKRSSELCELTETEFQKFDLDAKTSQTAILTIAPPNDIRPTCLEARLEPLFNRGKEYLGMSITLLDITKRKKIESKLQEQAESLEHLDQQKSRFFAGISHEFRTPLTLSLGALEDALQGRYGETLATLQEPLQSAQRNNTRLLDLVNQLLELSRLHTDSKVIHPQKVNLSAHMHQLVAIFESMTQKQNVVVHFIDHADSDVVFVDPDALTKITSNLFSNALKSMCNGGTIEICLKDIDRDWLELGFKDSGCGIPNDVLPHIFEAFYYYDQNNELWPQGTGVGLWIVKELLELHGANIAVTSQLDEGSHFTLTFHKGFRHFTRDQIENSNLTITETESHLPSAIPPLTLPDTPSSADTLTGVTDKQVEYLILVVEDNAEMRRYIRFHLTSHFRLIEAKNGDEGFELAQQLGPDLILSDVMMPKMDGMELCRKLKQDIYTSHIPVLLLTARSDRSDRIDGLKHGADDYLVKPFDVEELNIRITNLIQSREMLKSIYRQHRGMGEASGRKLPEIETNFLDTLQQYITANITNPDIKNADLARVANMSERSLARKLKGLTGETIAQMLLNTRLTYSSELLSNRSLSVAQISDASGFSDPSYFSKAFKKQFGSTPTQFRKYRALTAH